MSDALQTFVTSETAAERLDALRGLAQTKSLATAANKPEFRAGVDRAVNALTDQRPLDRLLALSAIGRLWSSCKSLRVHLEAALSSGEFAEPAPLLSLDDSDDREYAAEALRLLHQPWVPRFAATAAVREESAEKARRACIEAMLASTGDLAAVLSLLSERLAGVSFETERPSDSIGRRVKRVLNRLHDRIALHPRLRADGAGAALGTMLYESFRRAGQPATHDVRNDVVTAAAELIHDIVRVRFAQAVDPRTYEALEIVRRWFDAYAWDEFAGRSDECSALVDDIKEAIGLLGRAGITDSRMKAVLAIAKGSETRAEEELRILAEIPGLSEQVRDWLVGATAPKILASLEESGMRRVDDIIAEALIHTGSQSPERNVASSAHTDLMRAAVEEVARARGLEIALSVGETVDYSPLDHALEGGSRMGVRRVRILQQQVRAQHANGTFRIVRKALVTPVDE